LKPLTIAFTATAVALAIASAGREKCPVQSNQMAAVADTQTKLFAALEGEDQKTWERLTDPDFVAFEGGQRYSRQAIFDLIKSAHAANRHFQWSVTEARIETDCTVATLIYTNRGAITEGTSRSPVSWLETVTFRYADGVWRAVFLESMRGTPSN
jgi:hypothetical protein